MGWKMSGCEGTTWVPVDASICVLCEEMGMEEFAIGCDFWVTVGFCGCGGEGVNLGE